MKRIALLLTLLLAVASCGKQTADNNTSAQSSGQDVVVQQASKDNVGDLEQAIHIDVQVAEESASPNIKAEPLMDQMNRMSLQRVTVQAPFPKELWLKYLVKTRRSFPKNPGVLHIKTFLDDREIDSFSTVIGESTLPSVPERTLNVLAGLDHAPEKIVLDIKIDALLMPEGTDPKTIDPATATTTEDRRSTAIATPPIQIKFVGDPGAMSAPAPEAPADAPVETTTEAPAEPEAAAQ